MRYLVLTLFALALLSLPVGYIRLCGAMRRASVSHPPHLHFFFVFGAVGTLIPTIAFAGSVPGALAAILAVVVAPIVILFSSCFLYRRQRDSRFHNAAFWSGLAYVGLIVFGGLIIASFAS